MSNITNHFVWPGSTMHHANMYNNISGMCEKIFDIGKKYNEEKQCRWLEDDSCMWVREGRGRRHNSQPNKENVCSETKECGWICHCHDVIEVQWILSKHQTIQQINYYFYSDDYEKRTRITTHTHHTLWALNIWILHLHLLPYTIIYTHMKRRNDRQLTTAHKFE